MSILTPKLNQVATAPCTDPIQAAHFSTERSQKHAIEISRGSNHSVFHRHNACSSRSLPSRAPSLTVGFIMMMIVGVSSKVVPTLSGVDVKSANSLWPTFVLLNLGNLTRVSFQIATDFSPDAYAVMGVSGFIEVVGLTLWAYELVANLATKRHRTHKNR